MAIFPEQPTRPESPGQAFAHSAAAAQTGADDSPPVIPDYDLLRRIGRGAYGEVWLARNVTGSFVAVKMVARGAFDHDRPFEREFEGIEGFEPISRSDPSQLAILHVGRGKGFFYYVMELADAVEKPGSDRQDPKEIPDPKSERASNGKLQASDFALPSAFDFRPSDSYVPHTLREDLKRHGRLPVSQCVEIGLALSRALAHLHRSGLVHRDVKASNVIFVGGVPKLADIGLVTSVDATRSLVGTEGYIAPEGSGTPQADLYSLGKLLYEISTGCDRKQFPSLPDDIATHVERGALIEFNAIITRACQFDPRERYAKAEAILADLELLRRGQSVQRKRKLQYCFATLAKSLIILATVGLLAAVAAILLRVVPPSDPFPDGPDSSNDLANRLCDKGIKIIRSDNYGQSGEAYTNFHEAIKLDPNFPRPYVGLLEMVIREPVTAFVPTTPKELDFRWLADKLKQVAPHLAATYVAQSHLSYSAWDLQAAEHFARKATKANPKYELAHTAYAFMLLNWGRPLESRNQLEASQTIDKSKAIVYRMIGHTYYAQRNFTNAVNWYHKALDLDQHHFADFLWLGHALEALGRYPEAITNLERAKVLSGGNESEVKPRYRSLREAFLAGDAHGYWQRAWEFSQLKSNQDFYDQACLRMRLGDTNGAFDLLDKAFQAHEGDARESDLNYLLFDECWDGVHDHPRFKRVLEGVGFTKVMLRPKK